MKFENEADESMNEQEQEREGVSIELFIASDGEMTVSVEQDDEESEGEETPVASLEEAIRLIRKHAQGAMTDKQAAEEEDAAYKAEMKSSMSRMVGM